MRNLVRELAKKRGMAILISSHLLTEVEQVCDRFIILHKGRVVHESVAAVLQQRLDEVDVLLRPGPEVADALRRHPRFRSLTPTDAGALLCRFDSAPAEVPDLVRWLVRENVAVEQVCSRQRTLEELFLEITAEGGCDVRSDAF
jgi:ABC-2 type transport system ATP-binding protein